MASSSSLCFYVFSLVFFLASSSSSQARKNASHGHHGAGPLTGPTFTSNNPSMAFLPSVASPAHPAYIKTPVFPRSYRAHSITLSIGNPPQKLSFMVDTGSSLVWAPCTSRYQCTNCSLSSAHPKTFHPQLSRTSRILECSDRRCSFHMCSHNCSYSYGYDRGSTHGYMLLEDLHFPVGKTTIHSFLLGCSTSGVAQPHSDGFAGFSRSPMSLPVQMGVKKFAYCLKSHYFDGNSSSSPLIFDFRDGHSTENLSYAPFLKRPNLFSCYLGVESMILGNKLLPIPSEYLAPGSDGRGGVVIDSGFTNGYMRRPVYEIVTNELKRQMSKYRRSREAERELSLALCYNFRGHKSLDIPDLIYHFVGGAAMVVPGNRCFWFPRTMYYVGCFPIETDISSGFDSTPTPAIVLGNYQQVNHYLEFDLQNDRLGFRRQTC